MPTLFDLLPIEGSAKASPYLAASAHGGPRENPPRRKAQPFRVQGEEKANPEAELTLWDTRLNREKALAESAHITDPKERERLAESCEPWVNSEATRYANIFFKNTPPLIHQARLDFVAAGRMGVALALNKFDPKRPSERTGLPVKFFTVARSWITQQIQQRARELTKEYQRIGTVLSLDTQTENENGDMSSPSMYALTARPEDHEQLAREFDGDGIADEFWDHATRLWPKRYRRILEARFRQGLTLTEIGRREGISKERVRQILMRAKKWLRADPWMKEEAGDE